MNIRVQFLVVAALTFSFAAHAQSQSKKANKEQLDSIITLEYVQGKAGFKEKTEFRYTHFEKLREEKVDLRNADNSGWRPVLKKEYTYDSQEFLVEVLWTNWDSASSLWVNGLKSSYTNNTNGQATQIDFLLWNKNTSAWEKTRQQDYTYTSNGDVSSYNQGAWTNGAVVPEEKTDYFYHADNRPDFSSTSSYNGSTWDSVSKLVYTYAGNNDPGGLLYWKWVSGKFLQIAHSNHTPDFNGNNAEWNYMSYQDGNTLDFVTRISYTYDLAVDFADLVGLQNNEIIPFANKLTAGNQTRQENGVGNFDPQFDYLYYYSGYNPSAVFEVRNEMLEFYPNPATNSIQLNHDAQQFESYIIYDLQGRAVLKGNFDFQTSQIDITDLSAGIYTIQVRADATIYTNKLIKK